MHYGGGAAAAIVVPVLVAVIKIAGPVVAPKSSPASKVALASLGVASVVAVFAPRLNGPFVAVVADLVAKIPEPWRPDVHALGSGDVSVAGLTFLAVVIVAVNWFMRSPPAISAPAAGDDDFPERTFTKRRESYRGALLRELDRIDAEANWSDDHFVPLQAEVEIRSSSSSRRRRITNLVDAIRRDRKSRIFLVLGDPGSGKSVALRKLYRYLLGEVPATRCLPLYVNLREWELARSWTREAPPTAADLFDFVLSNLKGRTDVFGAEFLDDYFKRLLDGGRLFFLLDSFDEIPAVLDVDERSWLIEGLSRALDQFLAGTHDSRGVVASRLYRRPGRALDATAVLEIRPLTERRIAMLLRQAMVEDDAFTATVFRTRRELIPLARNPFTASLITAFARRHGRALPAGQSELYESYVRTRMEQCGDFIAQRSLRESAVRRNAEDIAYAMFEGASLGLEAPLAHLEQQLPGLSIAPTVDVLVFARLGRLSNGAARRFSFVHRRFNEYFLVTRLQRDPSLVPMSAIPTDSRFRDAMVLYCEVATESEAATIARYCWQHASQLFGSAVTRERTDYMAGVHALRFLSDAFRNRLACIAPFRRELAEMILRVLDSGSNLLEKKLSVEALSLLDEEDLRRGLVAAARVNNAWIDETAFRAAQYATVEDPKLSFAIGEMVNRIPTMTFVARWRDLQFALGLSESLRWARAICVARVIYLAVAWLALPLLLIAAPTFLTMLLAMYCSFASIQALEATTGESMPLPRSIARYHFEIIAPLLLILFAVALPLFSNASWFAPFRHLATTRVPTSAQSALLLTAVLVSFPWHWLALLVVAIRIPRPPKISARGSQAWFTKVLRETRRFSAAMAFLPILGSIVFAIGWLIVRITNRPEIIEWIVLGSIGLSGVLFVATVAWQWWAHRRVSRAEARMAPTLVRAEMTRVDISAHWATLRTDAGRRAFVWQLRTERVSASGDWPDDGPPYTSNDEASTMLAQLDEAWLGLAR